MTKLPRREILEGVRRGLAADLAAQSAGISIREWTDYVARGSEGEEPYATLLRDIDKARATFQSMLLDKLQAHGANPKAWVALAWILERTDPEHYAQRQVVKVQVERELARAVEVLSKVLPNEWYARALTALCAEFGVALDGSPAQGSDQAKPTAH